MRRWGKLASGSVLGLVLLVSAAAPGSAECPGTDRWPSFVAVAPGAGRIVVGRVTGILERNRVYDSLRFRIRVTEVPRGSAPATMDLGAYADAGPGSCINSVLTVRVGDLLAFALDDPDAADGVPGPVSAVAFLDRRPDTGEMPGMERLTLARVRALAMGLPAPDMARGPSPSAPSPWALLVLAAAGGGLIGGSRFVAPPRRQRRGG